MTDEQLQELQAILAGQRAYLKEYLQLPPRFLPRYRIGQIVQINLQSARIVTGTIKKIFRKPDAVRLLVQYECNEIALVHHWQTIRSSHRQ